jgi:VanZ family protein
MAKKRYSLKTVLFVVWLCMTTIVLLIPAETVEQTGAAVRQQPAIKAQAKSFIYKAVNDGENWHLFWFFVLAAIAVSLPVRLRIGVCLVWFLGLNAYGFTMEVIQQTLIPGRAFELQDLGRNAIGIAFGLSVVMIIRRVSGGGTTNLH